ncbi:MAG: hypothetical protein JWP35_3810 [Caulobacter sp.]|nr:hypothetical protein [Caulobacter sp.]
MTEHFWTDEPHPRPDMVARARHLAASGSHTNLESVRRQLICEGFVQVRHGLSDWPLRWTLARLCREASTRQSRRA